MLTFFGMHEDPHNGVREPAQRRQMYTQGSCGCSCPIPHNSRLDIVPEIILYLEAEHTNEELHAIDDMYNIITHEYDVHTTASVLLLVQARVNQDGGYGC